ncbi:hypothetical protein KEJ47_05115 [Candidatus Bathyarchaeota archaeon]|nr:hypothetical protein [Candidatus Bathyarchaeota archaeon]
MIRERLALVCLIIFVWVSMILGLLVINLYIVPLELPGVNPFVTGVLKVILSLFLSVLWLWVWRRMVVMIFWRSIKEQQSYI